MTNDRRRQHDVSVEAVSGGWLRDSLVAYAQSVGPSWLTATTVLVDRAADAALCPPASACSARARESPARAVGRAARRQRPLLRMEVLDTDLDAGVMGSERERDPGGLFGVPLDALAKRRANPPPLIAELDSLLGSLSSCSALAAALDAATHASLRQPLELVIAALEAQGAHASLSAALADGLAAALPNVDVPALGIAVLLRFLRRLPTPLLPCELYPLVLSSGGAALPALLRKRLPVAHNTLLDALGAALGDVLRRCGISCSGGTEASEAALSAMAFVFAPALMRPRPDAVGIPPRERGAAERATCQLLLYHAQRAEYRSIALSFGGGGVEGELVALGNSGDEAAARASESLPPHSPPAVPAVRLASTGFRRARGVASPGVRITGTPPSAPTRGAALATRSVASVILSMFEREFGPQAGACIGSSPTMGDGNEQGASQTGRPSPVANGHEHRPVGSV